MLKIFNLKAKKENAKKKEIKRTEKLAPHVSKLSRKESKALQAKAKLEYCGNDDDLGYC